MNASTGFSRALTSYDASQRRFAIPTESTEGDRDMSSSDTSCNLEGGIDDSDLSLQYKPPSPTIEPSGTPRVMITDHTQGTMNNDDDWFSRYLTSIGSTAQSTVPDASESNVETYPGMMTDDHDWAWKRSMRDQWKVCYIYRQLSFEYPLNLTSVCSQIILPNLRRFRLTISHCQYLPPL